jgi:hypothetical protein
MRGCHEPPESLARGTLSEGFPRNLGELLVSCGTRQVLVSEGNQRWRGRAAEQSYEPIVPMMVGNRRATVVVAATGPTGGKGETNQHIG